MTQDDIQEALALEAVYESIIQWDEGGGKRRRRELAQRIVALFTTPVQRPWVGLTGVEINHIWAAHHDAPEALMLAVQSKLKEKNA